MVISIRTLTPDDLNIVNDIDDISSNFVSEGLNSENYAWSIFNNKELIGYCTLGYADDPYMNYTRFPQWTENSLCLSDVFIKEEYRGQGLALKLIEETLIKANPDNAPVFLTLLNPNLQYLYVKLGFKCLNEYTMIREISEIDLDLTSKIENREQENTKMINKLDFECREKLKEIYTLAIEIFDIAPDENECSEELNAVFADIANLKGSMEYIIDDLQQENHERYNNIISSDDEFAFKLYNYLIKNEFIDDSEYNRETVFSDVYNLRATEWLDFLEWNNDTRNFFDYLGYITPAIVEKFSKIELTNQEYLDLLNDSEIVPYTISSLEDVEDDPLVLWDYPLEEIDYCMEEKILVVWLKEENRLYEVPLDCLIPLDNLVNSNKLKKSLNEVINEAQNKNLSDDNTKGPGERNFEK